MNVTVFDTTLRDGEQTPGASMSAPDRLRVALALDTASPSVLASIRDISAQVRDAEVVANESRNVDGAQMLHIALSASESALEISG